MHSLFSEAFFHALLWMLVHSLWQALAAAGVAGAVILGTRNRPAALRYNLLVGVGLIFGVAAALTFRWHYYQFAQVPELLPAVSMAPAVERDYPYEIATSRAWLQACADWINRHADALTRLWLAAAAGKGLWLSWQYRQTRVLRRRQIVPAEPYWQQKLQELSVQMGIKQTVGFFLSGLVQVPVVVGYFKPVLLVPVGFLNGLRPADVEAILVHELAHIRRADYLVNLVQHLVELVFFFNPALLWLSGQIRRVREHCCDDIAVSCSGNKQGYIRALVQFQERVLANAWVTAFTGKMNMPLLERVKRLINNHNQTLTKMEKFSLLTGMLSLAMLGFAFGKKAGEQVAAQTPALPETKAVAPAPASDPTPKGAQVLFVDADAAYQGRKPPATSNPRNVDTTGNGKYEINTHMNGKSYRMTFVQDKLVALTVDGVAVPESRFGEYAGVVKTVLEHKAEAEKHAIAAREHARRAEAMAGEAKAQAAKAEAMSQEAHSHAKEAAQHGLEAGKHLREAEVHAAQAKEHAVSADVHAREAKVQARVYDELVKDGLLKKDENPFTFSMEGGKMVVNGVEQPQSVYDKYQKLIAAERQRLGLR